MDDMHNQFIMNTFSDNFSATGVYVQRSTGCEAVDDMHNQFIM